MNHNARLLMFSAFIACLLFMTAPLLSTPIFAACSILTNGNYTISSACTIDADTFEGADDPQNTESSTTNNATVTVNANLTLISGSASPSTKLLTGILSLPWTAYFTPSTDGTLQNSLIAYWKLEEVSGNRSDTVGTGCGGSGCTLTDNNTVTYTTGKVGNAGDFEANNSEFLEATDNASLSTGDIDFTISAWVQLESKPVNPMLIVSKRDSGSVGEYRLQWQDTTNTFLFRILDSAGNSVGVVSSTSFGSPSLATWYHIVAWHDSVANTVNIKVNNGTTDSAATTGVPSDTAANFRIGAHVTAETDFWDGLIDEVGFWKKVLTAQEITDLYNSGSANTFDYRETVAIGSSNAAVVLGPVYIGDGEADGWAGSWTLATATASGKRRLGLMRSFSTLDCNDAAYSVTNSCYSYSQAWYYGYAQAWYYGYAQAWYYGYGQGMGYWSYAYGYSTCFPKDTEILMADGTRKSIQEIRPGDRILSYDLQTNQTVAGTVSDLIIHPVVTGYLIINGTLHINEGYPTWVVNKGAWIPAGNIKAGDLLLGADNQPMKVSTISRVDGSYTGFHMTLAEENPGNFFAGGVLVHPK